LQNFKIFKTDQYSKQ